jgi:hypothetical protein
MRQSHSLKIPRRDFSRWTTLQGGIEIIQQGAFTFWHDRAQKLKNRCGAWSSA